MFSKKNIKTFGLFIISVCVIIPLTVRADVYIKQKNHTDAFQVIGQSQPAKDEIFVTWMSNDKARLDHGENVSTIVRLDKNMMYMINHDEMKYMEFPVGGTEDIISSAIAGSGLSGEEKAQAQKMMKGFSQMMSPKVTVTDTGETKKIKNWSCKKYLMKMTMMGTTSTQEIWATEDIKIDYELYRTLGFSMMAQTPGAEDMLKEMKKIKGLTVMSTGSTSMMGSEVKSSQELLEYAEQPAPSGTYEVPEGYKKETK